MMGGGGGRRGGRGKLGGDLGTMSESGLLCLSKHVHSTGKLPVFTESQ